MPKILAANIAWVVHIRVCSKGNHQKYLQRRSRQDKKHNWPFSSTCLPWWDSRYRDVARRLKVGSLLDTFIRIIFFCYTLLIYFCYLKFLTYFCYLKFLAVLFECMGNSGSYYKLNIWNCAGLFIGHWWKRENGQSFLALLI